MKLKGVQKEVTELIKRSENILIMPSSPPDGDCLGSALALYCVLKKLKKEVTVVFADPIPDVYKFLPNINVVGKNLNSSRDVIITLDCRSAKIDTIKSSLENDKINIIISPKDGGFDKKDISFHYGDTDYDLIITVDTAELSQLGRMYEDNVELFTEIPVINIDHHISNTQYGKVNYTDVMASSSTQLLIPIFEALEEETGQKLMDEDIATLLLAGVITDTGSFQNANTTPKSFAIAAQLVSYGARQQEIIRNIYKTKKLSMLKLWGRVLSNIRTDDKYRMVWSTVSKKDLQETNSKIEQTGDIIDELMTNAPGAEIIFLLKEKDEGVVSGSIRTTTSSADASYLAEQFNGGGHTQAAGFTLHGADLKQIEKDLIKIIKDYQKQRLNIIDEEPEEEHKTQTLPQTEQKAADTSEVIKVKFSKDIEIEPGREYKIDD